VEIGASLGLLSSLCLAIALRRGAIFMKFGLAPQTRTIFMTQHIIAVIEFVGFVELVRVILPAPDST